MAFASGSPFVSQLAHIFTSGADGNDNGNVAFGADESSLPSWTPAQSGPTRSTTGNTDGFRISFDDASLSTYPNTRVIMVENPYHEIMFTTAGSVKVTKATWQVRNNNQILSIGDKTADIEPDPMDVVTSSTTTSSLNTLPSPHSTEGAISDAMVLTSNMLVLPVIKLTAEYIDDDMYIKLDWQSNDGAGSTTSGVFTVLDGQAGDQRYNKTVARLEKMRVEDRAQNVGKESDDSASSQDGVSTTTSVSPVATGSSKASPSGIADGPNNASGGSSGSSISPGAIAGIVVGSVLGLALIAFLLWFFVRRRRRADDISNGAYGPSHGPHEYLAGKEAHARVTESPHSPYSDDGQHPQHQPEQQRLQRDDPEIAVPAPAVDAVDAVEHRPFAPYSVEEEHTPIAARSVEDMTRNGARSSTPNVNSNVSHLIEDGMTEDEIRRLEEEERALDAAIEQAGQGQGQGQPRQP